MSQSPPPDESGGIDLRQRLRELGYLNNSVARFVAGGDSGGSRPLLRVMLRAAALGWFALLALTLLGMLIVNPFLLRYPTEVLILTGWLAVADLLMTAIFAALFLAIAAPLLLLLKSSQRWALGFAHLISAATAAAVFIYLTFWWAENSAFGFGSELFAWRNLAFVIPAFLIAALFHRITLVVAYVLLLQQKSALPEHQRGQRGRQRWLLFAAIALVSFFGFLYATYSGNPTSTGEGGAHPTRAVYSLPPLALIGIEGPDASTLRLLLADDRLPFLGSLASSGALLDLQFPAATASEEIPPPVLWTSLATGVAPEIHGIVGFEDEIPTGLKRRIEVSRQHVGLYQVLKIILPALRMTHTVPLSSEYRRALSVWEIASMAGEDVAVVNWWASWPPADVRGSMVTDRDFLNISNGIEAGTELVRLHHEAMQSVLDDPPGIGSAIGSSEPVRNAFAMDRFHAAAGRYLFSTGKPSFYALFLQGADIIEHNLLQHPELSIIERGKILAEYCAQLDKSIGEQVRILPDEATIMVLATPGLDAPVGQVGTGIVIIARKNRPLGFSGGTDMAGEDVAPTVLALLGIPPSREMAGRVHPVVAAINLELLDLDKQRPERYPRRKRSQSLITSSVEDEAYLSRLKTLGYISSK